MQYIGRQELRKEDEKERTEEKKKGRKAKRQYGGKP